MGLAKQSNGTIQLYDVWYPIEKRHSLKMTGLGIVLTVCTLVIIIFRIKAEVKRKGLSTKGGIILGLAFVLSLVAIVSVSLITSQDSLGIRLFVLAFCIAFVFSSYKFAKRPESISKTRD